MKKLGGKLFLEVVCGVGDGGDMCKENNMKRLKIQPILNKNSLSMSQIYTLSISGNSYLGTQVINMGQILDFSICFLISVLFQFVQETDTKQD